jgi:hypothetical protein
MKHGPILWHTVTLGYCVLRSGFSMNFSDLCQPDRELLRYICMQDKKQLDYDKPETDKNEPFQEQYLPTSYDWRQSNCDERRSTPCRRVDQVRHTFH